MNIKHALLAVTVVCVSLGWSLVAQRTLLAQELGPQKQPMVIPLAAQGGRSIECVVPVGPSNPISAVAFSPDAKTLAVGGYQEVVLWDLATGKLARRLAAGQLGESVRALVFLDDGKLLAVGQGTPGSSGAVKILNVETGRTTASLDEPPDVVHCLAVSPDGKLLAASGTYTSVHVWSIVDKNLVATIKGHSAPVGDVTFSAAGKLMATAGADRSLRVWKVEDWGLVATFVEQEAVCGSAFGADGITLVLGIAGPTARGIRVRRTNNVRYTRSFSTPVGTPLDLVGVAKGNRLYVASSDHTVKAMDSNNGRLLATFTGHNDWVDCVAVSADGAKVASGSADGTVKLWNSADGKLLATLVQLSPRTDQWLVVTAQGYLATSSAGELAWNVTNVKTPTEQITGILDQPELVKKAIAGEKTDPPALE